MKTVLITGASGMVGRALTDKLLSKGIAVIGTDNKPNNFVNAPNYTFCQASIDDKAAVSGIMSSKKVDVLVHLACSVDNDFPPVISPAEEKLCSAVDKYIYKAAVDAGVSDIILLSTHQVYAITKSREPVRETADEKPTTSYGKMKFDSEKVLSKATGKSDVKVTVARTSPIYTKGFIDNLRSKIYDPREGCSFVFGYGDYGYSFCCLFNLVDFLAGIILIQPGINYQGIYNVCDTKPIAAKEILDFLREFHKLGPVVQRNYSTDSIKAAMSLAGKTTKMDYRYNDLSLACSNISYDNTKAQRISTFRWKLATTK